VRPMKLRSHGAALVIAPLLLVQGCASRSVSPALDEQTQSPALHVSGAQRAFPVVAAERRDVPLRQAVEHLVPADFGIRWIDVEPAHQATKVAWRADQTWPDAVGEAVRGVPGLTVHIGTGSRLVLIQGTGADRRSAPPGPAPAGPSAQEPPLKLLPAPEPAGRKAFLKTSTRAETAGGTALPAAQWTLSVQDKSLRAVLNRWSQDAGWHLFWELGVDYPIKANASIPGNFEEAVAMVIHSLERADVPPKAIFYRGNQVLRVLPRGME
jgi:hypothetical protein